MLKIRFQKAALTKVFSQNTALKKVFGNTAILLTHYLLTRDDFSKSIYGILKKF